MENKERTKYLKNRRIFIKQLLILIQSLKKAKDLDMVDITVMPQYSNLSCLNPNHPLETWDARKRIGCETTIKISQRDRKIR